MSTIRKEKQANTTRVLGRKVGRELSSEEVASVSGAGTNWTRGQAQGDGDTDFDY